jgi:hypothetical protein
MHSTYRAARIVGGIRPQGSSACVRRRLASEIVRDVRALERKIADLDGRIKAEVEASGTTLTEIFGVGPIPWPQRSWVRGRQREALPDQGPLLRLLLWDGTGRGLKR